MSIAGRAEKLRVKYDAVFVHLDWSVVGWSVLVETKAGIFLAGEHRHSLRRALREAEGK